MSNNEFKIKAEVIKTISIEYPFVCRIFKSGGHYDIACKTKQESELIAKRINCDVEKVVREMIDELAPGFAEMKQWHTSTLKELQRRLEAGK